MARWEQEIPAAEAAAVQMAGELGAVEKQLEGLLEGIKGEVEAHHQALSKVGLPGGGALGGDWQPGAGGAGSAGQLPACGGRGGRPLRWLSVPCPLCARPRSPAPRLGPLAPTPKGPHQARALGGADAGGPGPPHLAAKPHPRLAHAPAKHSLCPHAKVRAELAPWEAQMQEVQGRMGVATSERDMLLRRGEDAKVWPPRGRRHRPRACPADLPRCPVPRTLVGGAATGAARIEPPHRMHLQQAPHQPANPPPPTTHRSGSRRRARRRRRRVKRPRTRAARSRRSRRRWRRRGEARRQGAGPGWGTFGGLEKIRSRDQIPRYRVPGLPWACVAARVVRQACADRGWDQGRLVPGAPRAPLGSQGPTHPRLPRKPPAARIAPGAATDTCLHVPRLPGRPPPRRVAATRSWRRGSSWTPAARPRRSGRASCGGCGSASRRQRPRRRACAARAPQCRWARRPGWRGGLQD